MKKVKNWIHDHQEVLVFTIVGVAVLAMIKTMQIAIPPVTSTPLPISPPTQ